MMQEIYVTANDPLCLALLCERHCAAGFKGRCIVRFAPTQYLNVVHMNNFLPIDSYKFTKPVDPEEIGAAYIFHMVPDGPVDFSECEIL